MKIKRKKKGQAMVEFTAVLGLSFLLIALAISGFQLMYMKIVFNLAAYDGVRTCIVHNGSNTQGRSAAASIVNSNKIGTVDNLSITISNVSGNKKKCTVSGTIKYFLPMIDPTFSAGKISQSRVTSSFTMQKER